MKDLEEVLSQADVIWMSGGYFTNIFAISHLTNNFSNFKIPYFAIKVLSFIGLPDNVVNQWDNE